MSEQRQLLADSAARLFEANASWDEIEALGIADILVAAERGGSGADWDDACAVLHAVGRRQIPLPIAEAMIARRLLAAATLEAPGSPLSIATNPVGTLSRGGSGWTFSGALASVPWGRDVARVVTTIPFEGRPHIVVLAVADANINKKANLADEPRDDLQFDAAPALAAAAECREAEHLFDYAALARTAQIAGALQTALDLSIAYCLERKQFGRPIGQFQAVQQQLALLGGETAAATCASRSAAIAASIGGASFEIAAAKLRANQAIGVVTAIAHQVHGAIGFTREYALRRATQRLWSWRSECGNDRYWSERLGRTVITRGADSFWSDLVAR
ncbi:MAG TPA: acyl-CoA dehydrogenase family protein [Steroidobacteraceae bacterium]|nr:acyl-CoA dehydrogenase family protein [Steroidobacteraceae bacterium]